MKQRFPASRVLGNPGFAVVMADFVRQNSELLMAATDGARIKIQKIDGGLNTVTEVEVAGLPQVVGLHWWQPQAGQLLPGRLRLERHPDGFRPVSVREQPPAAHQ
jgi:hypothetical protein